jgi:hypothetical protein
VSGIRAFLRVEVIRVRGLTFTSTWLYRLRTKGFWLVEDDVFGRYDRACALRVIGARRKGINVQTRVVGLFRYCDGRRV